VWLHRSATRAVLPIVRTTAANSRFDLITSQPNLSRRLQFGGLFVF
jgi:hypothetical protein